MFGPRRGERSPPPATWGGVDAKRLSRLPRAEVGGVCFPVAIDRRAQLLGLAGLSRERARSGLLLPGCACVHTFWMRFALDLYFLDHRGGLLGARLAVPPRRLVHLRGAAMVLERPAAQSGESAPVLAWGA
ncbi:MAG: DUF192 domain-containing protein [Actinobacteria bacterium]|nr:DUF192 domain-containing protein [Actinomycetota bacterium]